ncbi:amidohydrolase family protein [Robiginitalea sp. IMCC44478]|uniref:amidohydrolase family protein n=1 Tax=Robiginitalea sp. IMCC44478 TaxID=3459122 RepID=UPI0040412B01
MIHFKDLILLSLFIIVMLFAGCDSSTKSKTIKYSNGYVFNGASFEKKSFVVNNGELNFSSAANYDTIVDLKNKYIIPAFGDAHTHNFDDVAKFDSIYKAYIDEGTFYVQVLTNHYSNFLKIKDSLNTKGRIDAKFAHGGITSTGGHPHSLYESQALNYSWRAMLDPTKKDEILSSKLKKDDAYYLIDSVSDISENWGKIISKNPDFLKLYLSNIVDRDKNIETKNIGTYGLSEDVLTKIAELAREDNISLIAHIETVSDFEIALKHNIKYFAHMPGYGGGIGDANLDELVIPDSLLEKAGKNKIVLTPTVSFAKYYAYKWDGTNMSLDTSLLKKKNEFLRKQLIRFKEANITIALGADQGFTTLSEEINDLKQINAFSNLELLNLLISTPRLIFPNRKIGELENGYEATFLVLKDNPLEDMNNIRDIVLRVKNGIKLD